MANSSRCQQAAPTEPTNTMKTLSQVIDLWTNHFPNDLIVNRDVSVRTAKALQKRGIARYHYAQEDKSAYIELTSEGEEILAQEKAKA